MCPIGPVKHVTIESEDPETDGKPNVCPICLNSFDSIAGVRQHWTKRHSTEEILDEINKKMQLMSQQSPTSSITKTDENPLNDTHAWNKFQIIYDDNSTASGKVYQQFNVIENYGDGDCLFRALLEFLINPKNNFIDKPLNVIELRVRAVNHILKLSNDGCPVNLERFKDRIYINLKNHIPRLSRYDLFEFSDETIARTYSKYMSTPGNVELHLNFVQ